MKNFYIAVTVQQDRNETIFTKRINSEPNIGYYAYVVKCSEQDNIKSILGMIGGLLYANIYPTKKKASEIPASWNDGYKANGTYFFN